MTIAPGTTLGRYQILEPLGSGGMATVYKAYEPSLDRVIALKVIRQGFAEDADFAARFRREAQSVAKLDHPNIVHVHAFDESEGRLYLAMQYLEGGTLKDRLNALEPGTLLPPAEVASIVGQVADALAYAHEQGVVHRDIKPSNIMLTTRGRAVVTDFGIAKIVSGAALTQTGVGLGTPEYMAPEQGQGLPVDARSDIYSLGVLAYELLCGRLPYRADTPFAVVMAHVRDPLPLPSRVNPEIGPQTERALLRALAKTPAERFSEATQFAAALAQAIVSDRGQTAVTLRPVAVGAGPVLPVPPVSVAREGRGLPRRTVLFAGVGVLGALVVAGGLVGAVLGPPSPATRSAETASSAAPTAVPVSSVAASTTAAATAKPTPKFAIPPKGDLLFEARFDGTLSDLRGAPEKNGDVSALDYKVTPGAMELSVTKDPAPSPAPTYIRARWNTAVLRTYIWELELGFASGSRSHADLTLRNGPIAGAGTAAYRLRLDAAGEFAELFYVQFDATGKPGTNQPLASRVQLPGLGSGRAFTVAVVVEASRITVFVDQKQLLQATDARIDRSTLSPYVDLLQSGTVRMTGSRFYELPPQ